MGTKANLTPFGYVILLLLLYALSKTKIGYNLIYYALVLVLALLLVGQYKKIDKVLIKGEV